MTVYKNLAVLVKKPYKKIIKEGMTPKVTIDYTSPGYQDPNKIFSVGIFEDKIEGDKANRLRSFNVGDEFCLHTEKNQKGYNELVDMTDKSDVPQKKKTEYRKKDSGGWKKGGAKGNDDGAQVGNALTNAATLLPEGSSAADLESMAWDIIQVGERLKTKLKDFRAGVKAAPKAVANNTSQSTQDWGDETQEDLIDDDVDGMDW